MHKEDNYFMKFINHIFKNHSPIAVSILAVLTFVILVKVFAAPPGSEYNPGETLDPTCSPGSVNCSVDVGGIGGSGTANNVAKWSSSSDLTDSLLFDDGGGVGVGAPSNGVAMIEVTGDTATENLFSTSGGSLGISETFWSSLWLQGDLFFASSLNPGDLSFKSSLATTRMIIKNDGNVGIGTTSPTSPLHVNAATAGTSGFTSKFIDSNGSIGSTNVFGWTGAGVNQKYKFIAATGSGLEFGHLDDSFGGWTRDMTISTAGNVGIGTVTPPSLLTVGNVASNLNGNIYSFGYGASKTSATEIRVGALAQSTDALPFVLYLTATGNATPSLREILIQTGEDGANNLGKLMLQKNGGIVGIGGVIASSEKLNVAGHIAIDNADAALFLNDTDGGGRKFSIQSFDGTFRIYDNTASAERMTILADGNVGIGTTTPTSRLSVVGTGSAGGISIETTGGSGQFQISDPDFSEILLSTPSNGLSFNVSEGIESEIIASGGPLNLIDGTTSLFLDDSSHIGVNNGSPISALQIGIPDNSTFQYFQFDFDDGAPPAADCDDPSTEVGRAVVGGEGSDLYICSSGGWTAIPL